MAYEIERKFLIKSLPPELGSYPKSEIKQGYIRVSDDGTEDRVRKKGALYFHTVKSGAGLMRQESEREISENEFKQLWPLTEGRRVNKTRYDITFGELLIELDVYSGDLEGLIVAEVEFETIEQSKSFTPPPWFGDEITQDERYKNKNLALNGII